MLIPTACHIHFKNPMLSPQAVVLNRGWGCDTTLLSFLYGRADFFPGCGEDPLTVVLPPRMEKHVWCPNQWQRHQQTSA